MQQIQYMQNKIVQLSKSINTVTHLIRSEIQLLKYHSGATSNIKQKNLKLAREPVSKFPKTNFTVLWESEAKEAALK